MPIKQKICRGKRLNTKSACKKFEDVFQESVDEAFSSLGEAVKNSLYFHIEHGFHVPKKDIPYRIEDFSDAVEKIFGLGARQVELLIMKSLNKKVNCDYKWKGPSWLVPDLTFKKYVELLRISYEAESFLESVEVVVDAGEKQEQRS